MIGKFAISKAGHDKDKLYVIVACDGMFVYVCDGRLRPVERPKRKRLKHIQIINQTVQEELLHKLEHHEKIMDEEIKYAIKHYNDPTLF